MWHFALYLGIYTAGGLCGFFAAALLVNARLMDYERLAEWERQLAASPPGALFQASRSTSHPAQSDPVS